MTHKTADIRAALCATQQQLALMMHDQANAPPTVSWPTAAPTPPPPVVYATLHPTYLSQTHHMYGSIHVVLYVPISIYVPLLVGKDAP